MRKVVAVFIGGSITTLVGVALGVLLNCLNVSQNITSGILTFIGIMGWTLTDLVYYKFVIHNANHS